MSTQFTNKNKNLLNNFLKTGPYPISYKLKKLSLFCSQGKADISSQDISVDDESNPDNDAAKNDETDSDVETPDEFGQQIVQRKNVISLSRTNRR